MATQMVDVSTIDTLLSGMSPRPDPMRTPRAVVDDKERPPTQEMTVTQHFLDLFYAEIEVEDAVEEDKMEID